MGGGGGGGKGSGGGGGSKVSGGSTTASGKLNLPARRKSLLIKLLTMTREWT